MCSDLVIHSKTQSPYLFLLLRRKNHHFLERGTLTRRLPLVEPRAEPSLACSTCNARSSTWRTTTKSDESLGGTIPPATCVLQCSVVVVEHIAGHPRGNVLWLACRIIAPLFDPTTNPPVPTRRLSTRNADYWIIHAIYGLLLFQS